MKTPFDEHIEWLRNVIHNTPINTAVNRRIRGAYTNALMDAIILREAEQKEIQGAFTEGKSSVCAEQEITAEQYYKQRFKTN